MIHRGSFGVQYLAQGHFTYWLEVPGIKPLTHNLVDKVCYHLSSRSPCYCCIYSFVALHQIGWKSVNAGLCLISHSFILCLLFGYVCASILRRAEVKPEHPGCVAGLRKPHWKSQSSKAASKETHYNIIRKTESFVIVHHGTASTQTHSLRLLPKLPGINLFFIHDSQCCWTVFNVCLISVFCIAVVSCVVLV